MTLVEGGSFVICSIRLMLVALLPPGAVVADETIERRNHSTTAL
jgi:hypothetical protein